MPLREAQGPRAWPKTDEGEDRGDGEHGTVYPPCADLHGDQHPEAA
jgi:hypothetical protein